VLSNISHGGYQLRFLGSLPWAISADIARLSTMLRYVSRYGFPPSTTPTFPTYSYVKVYLLNNGQFLPIGKMIETGAKIQINSNFRMGSQEILESWFSPLQEFESLVSPSQITTF
jgi:hypothetical protein